MLLEAENLTKSFGQLNILNDLSFHVEQGTLKSVIGPNGAGKTTLFNVLTGRFPPDGGQVRFGGHDVTRTKSHTLSKLGMARSFQINNFFPNLTAWENLQLAVQSRIHGGHAIWKGLPSDHTVDRKVEETLAAIELSEHADELALNLSYGDQRKLEIGLALGTEPILLLLDEPTSGMSRFESQSLIDLVEKLSKDVTILLIEHDIEMVMRVSDSILVIHYGEKIAEGTPSEIERDEEVQRVYLGGL